MAWMPRTPEPELMDDPREVRAYSESDFGEVNRTLAGRIIALGGARGRALDLGTGPASIPLELCRLARGWRVVAVDAGPRMLAEGRRRARRAGLAERLRFELCRIQELPPGLGRFDAVISNSLLHHLPDPLSLWRAAARHLRDDGRLVVQDLRRPGTAREVEALVRLHAGGESPLLEELFRQSLHAAFTPEEIREQILLAGDLEAVIEPISDRHVLVVGRRGQRTGTRKSS